MKRLNSKEVNEAFDNAFEVPLNLDHKPTQEEIFTLELLAVSGKAEDERDKEWIKLIEKVAKERAVNLGSQRGWVTDIKRELQKEL